MSSRNFNFREYVNSLNPDALETFANSSGTTVNYIKNHLIYKNKIPRPEMIDSLVLAANGAFTKYQFVSWLYDLKKA